MGLGKNTIKVINTKKDTGKEMYAVLDGCKTNGFA
jgi:hypothetical protein